MSWCGESMREVLLRHCKTKFVCAAVSVEAFNIVSRFPSFLQIAHCKKDMAATGTAASAQPVLGQGFRGVFVADDVQWLVFESTGEKVIYNAIDDCIFFQDDAHVASALKQQWDKRVHVFGPGPAQQMGPAYKLFKLQKLVRPDNSFFFMDLQTKTTMPADFSFDTRTHAFGFKIANSSSAGQPSLQILTWAFKMPPLSGNGQNIFMRLIDIQNALDLQSSTNTRGKWICKNWSSWLQAFGMNFAGTVPVFRSAVSHKALQMKKPDIGEAKLGQNCMEEYAGSCLFVLWLLLHLQTTIRESMPTETVAAKAKAAGMFSNLVQFILEPDLEYTMPCIGISALNFPETKLGQLAAQTIPTLFLPLRGTFIATLQPLTSDPEFNWLRKSLTRQQVIIKCALDIIFTNN